MKARLRSLYQQFILSPCLWHGLVFVTAIFMLGYALRHRSSLDLVSRWGGLMTVAGTVLMNRAVIRANVANYVASTSDPDTDRHAVLIGLDYVLFGTIVWAAGDSIAAMIIYWLTGAFPPA